MPIHARLYVIWVIAVGAILFAAALAHWTCADPLRFVTYLLLAVVAGTLKIRLPGMPGTYSLTFLFVLIGVADLTFAETVMIAGPSMITQSLWRPVVWPTRTQVAFNATAVTISVAVSFLAARAASSLPLRVILAAVAYYFTNTLLVSGIVALIDRKPIRKVWSRWFEWCIRYYFAGVLIDGVIIACNHSVGWAYSLLLLPLMYAEYFGYRLIARSQSGKRVYGAPDAS